MDVLLALTIAVDSLGRAWWLPFSGDFLFLIWMSRVLLSYPWGLVFHQECVDLILGCIWIFPNGSFKLPIQGTLLLGAFEWAVLYLWVSPPEHYQSVWWCVPFVTGAVGCHPLRPFPCLLHSLLEVSLSREPSPWRCWSWGWEEAETQVERRIPSELVHGYPHLPLHLAAPLSLEDHSGHSICL